MIHTERLRSAAIQAPIEFACTCETARAQRPSPIDNNSPSVYAAAQVIHIPAAISQMALQIGRRTLRDARVKHEFLAAIAQLVRSPGPSDCTQRGISADRLRSGKYPANDPPPLHDFRNEIREISRLPKASWRKRRKTGSRAETPTGRERWVSPSGDHHEVDSASDDVKLVDRPTDSAGALDGERLSSAACRALDRMLGKIILGCSPSSPENKPETQSPRPRAWTMPRSRRRRSRAIDFRNQARLLQPLSKSTFSF